MQEQETTQQQGGTQPETHPETQPEIQPETQPETQPEAQPKPQPDSQPKPQPDSQPQKRNYSDRIAELESKIAKMEAVSQLQGKNVVDMEVCTDLIMKGYTVEQLMQSKPYLFSSTSNPGVVKQPPKVISGTQTPKPQLPPVSSEGFVKSLAEMLISKF